MLGAKDINELNFVVGVSRSIQDIGRLWSVVTYQHGELIFVASNFAV